MNRVRIKFCGITRLEDAQFAVALGVDAIGLVMTRKSKRFAGIEQARAIRRSLPPFVSAVTLFMDDDPAWVAEAVGAIRPDLLQFHGAESAIDCKRYGYPYLKAVAMADASAMAAAMDQHGDAAGWLLDSHAPGEQGGSGRAFDWTSTPKTPARPVILAGGLTCDNVGSAIATARPYAVDVASGIESAPGIKDQEKMRRFADEVKRACDKS